MNLLYNTNVIIIFMSFLESFLLLLLFLGVLYDLVYYIGTVWRNQSLKITAKQKDMLGIPKDGK